MLVTNGQFVDNLLQEDADVNAVFHHLSISIFLLKKYGKLLFVEEVLTMIKAESSELYHFLKLLKLNKKHSIKDMKAIVMLLKKKAENYDKNFVILSDSQEHHMNIKSFLEKQFDHLHVEHHVVDEGKVSVSGEGWYYKRSLEQDAKRLLGL